MKRKQLFKKGMAGMMAACMVLGSVPEFTLSHAEAAENVQLGDLVLQQVAKLTPDFSPEVTEYTGTAYMSTATLNIFPFKDNTSDTVTVGKAGKTPVTVTEKTGNKADIQLTTGENDIEVTVSDGVDSKVYTLHITKKDSDYRGRTVIPNNEIKLETDFGGDLTKMIDKNASTAWSPTTVPTNETESNPATSFIVDLGKIRWVSRIQADMGGSGYSLWNNMARISVSTDKTNWVTVIDKGNMREDQTDVRYEFGKSYEARYIKYEIIKYNAAQLQINEMTFYEDANGEFPTYDPPADGNVQFVPGNPNIARGQEIVIKKGYPVSGWMPSGGYGRGTMTKEESELLGWDGPLFYDPELTNETFMLNNPDALWGIAKAPWGNNGMQNAGEPRDFVPANLQPYIKNAVNFCYGDEGGYSTAENARYKEWFDWSKETYPGTLVHSNQAGGNGWDAYYDEYVKQAEPDLLSFDDYYWHLNSNQWNGVYGMLNTSLWKNQREAALRGVDGTGEKPILFGQYLDVYSRDQPMSQKNLVTNLSILTGMKWLNYFRVEYQFDGCYLFDRDGTPTHGLYEWGEVNRYLKTIDDFVLKLNNDYVVVKPGQHLNANATVNNNVATGWHMGGFAENTAKNAEFGIQDVSAKNLNAGCNNGLAGDVVFGYFNALTGLTEQELRDTFGCSAPKAFMVLNGLNDGNFQTWNNAKIVNKEKGSTENTKQEITLTFTDTQGRTLKKVNHETGAVETVAITNNQLTLTLGGGEAELFFWEENLDAEASSSLESREAKYAFDGAFTTYWKAEDSQTTATLTNTFETKEIKKVIINEKGSNVSGFELEYKNGDEWAALGGGGSIGASKVIEFDAPVTTTGLRLVITSAEAAPAIREIRTYGPQEISADTYAVTASAGSHGSIDSNSLTVKAHEDAVIQATGDEGYIVDKAVSGKLYYYAEDDVILIPDVTENMSASIAFAEDIPDEITPEILRKAIKDALSLNKLNYVGSTWEALAGKIRAAQSVLADEKASNSQRKAAYDKIRTAKGNLEEAAATCPRDGITETTDFIDDTDSRISYQGSWRVIGGPWIVNKYMNSQIVIDDSSEGSVEYEFIGTGIEVFMESRSNSSDVNVEILNRAGETVVSQNGIICAQDETGADPPSLLKSVYSNQDLAYDRYTIKLTFAPNAAAGKRASLDGFRVTNTRGEVVVENITLDPDALTLNVGEQQQVNAVITPADVIDPEITWSTDNESVVSVENGLVTAVGSGKATVFASSGGTNAVCAVTVEGGTVDPIPVESVSLDRTSASLEVGASMTLTAAVAPANAADTKITWNTENGSVVTVDNGLVTAVGPGTAAVTASCGGKSASCSVTVTEKIVDPIPVESVSLDRTSASLRAGQNLTLTAAVAPANAADKAVTWSTSNPSVAEVSTNGTVSAKEAGTATITVTTKDGRKTASCMITVTANVPVVDKSALKSAIDEAGKLSSRKYTATSWKTFTTALSAAKNVYANPSAAANNVKTALDSLTKAKSGLVLKNGWIKENGKYRYYKKGAYLKNSWLTLKGRKYYLDSKGYRTAGLKKIKGKRYYFRESGKYAGVMVKGWRKIKGKRYYFKESGKYAGSMVKGRVKIKGKWYYMSSSGVMQKKKWVRIKKKRYYVKSSGVMATGWYKIGGKEWYFNKRTAAREGKSR